MSRHHEEADSLCENVDVETPEGFAVSIAYNKSGYQVIPKEDFKVWYMNIL